MIKLTYLFTITCDVDNGKVMYGVLALSCAIFHRMEVIMSWREAIGFRVGYQDICKYLVVSSLKYILRNYLSRILYKYSKREQKELGTIGTIKSLVKWTNMMTIYDKKAS